MNVTQGQVFDVPASLSTIVTIRENSSGYQRSLAFQNLTTDSLSIQIEVSNDGGSNWSLVGTAFTLGSLTLVAKEIAASYTNILRVRASGGGDDRDLVITYFRIFADGNTWTDPTL